MDRYEQRPAADQPILAAVSRTITQLRKRRALLWGGLLLLLVTSCLGSFLLSTLPFPLQADSHTLYSTDWSRDFATWHGTGWQKRLNGGVHSEHGGFFFSPYAATGADIQIDVQMKHLGVDAFVNGSILFGVALRMPGNDEYVVAIGDDGGPIQPMTPWTLDIYHALQDFAVVSVRVQRGVLTLLINGKQVAQRTIEFPFVGTLGLFAGGDSIVEARSFRVDWLLP